MTDFNSETLLLRQVNPKFLDVNQISVQTFLTSQAFLTSQVFTPFPKDNGLLSVHNSDLISAQQATELFEYDTCGSVAVTPFECRSIDLQNRPDPLDESPLGKAHHVVDYTGLTKKQQKMKATILKKYAEHRGFLYRLNTS